MIDWRQGVGIYVALIIGGIASMLTHFVDYIAILLIALGLLGITLYEDNKRLHEYQSRESGNKKAKS